MLWICDLNAINTNAVNMNGWGRGSKHEKGGKNRNRKANKRDGQGRGGSGDSF